jgi:hypothetical protein
MKKQLECIKCMYTLHLHKHQQLVNKCLCVFVNLIYKFRIILFIIEQTKSMSLNFYLGLNVMVDSCSISFTAISLLTNLLLHRILLQLCISRLSSDICLQAVGVCAGGECTCILYIPIAFC